MSHLIATFLPHVQAAASLFYVVGIIGSWIPEWLPQLRAVTAYGKLQSMLSVHASSRVAAAVEASRAVSVPKRWFTHFYIIGILVGLLVLSSAWLTAAVPLWSLALLGVYVAHTARRLHECLFVHRWSVDARMPLQLYIVGVAHYVFVPWTLLPVCSGTATVTTVLEAVAGFAASTAGSRGVAWAPSLHKQLQLITQARSLGGILAGLVLIGAGNYVQHVVHKALADLRSGRGGPGGADGPGARAGHAKADEEDGTIAQRIGLQVPGGRKRVGATPFGADPMGTAGLLSYGAFGHGSNSAGGAGTGIGTDLEALPEGAGNSAADRYRADGAASRAGQGQGTIHSPGADRPAVPAAAAAAYPVPRGGWFNYALCPHYTAEIAIYGGFLLVQSSALTVLGGLQAGTCVDRHPWLTWPGPVLLLGWTLSNLCVTGLATKRWYMSAHPHEWSVKYTAAVLPYLL